MYCICLPDTDIIDELDLSPEEAHGVPIGGDEEIAPHRINLINWDPVCIHKR